MSTRVHAFTDDALGEHDAVGLAALIKRGEVSAAEAAAAAHARAEAVNPLLNGIVVEPDSPRVGTDREALLFGVPTYVKDNTDLRGLPTQHGSAAFTARPAKADGPFAKQFLSTGVTVLGKSTLPEFGLNASTEFANAEPTRNPWNTEFSSGASSGGSAALVAASTWCPSRTAMTVAARSAFPRRAAAWSGSSPPGVGMSTGRRRVRCRSIWSPRAC